VTKLSTRNETSQDISFHFVFFWIFRFVLRKKKTAELLVVFGIRFKKQTKEMSSETLINFFLDLPLELVDLVLWQCNRKTRATLRLVSASIAHRVACLMRWKVRDPSVELASVLKHYGPEGIGYLNVKECRSSSEVAPVMLTLQYLREFRMSPKCYLPTLCPCSDHLQYLECRGTLIETVHLRPLVNLRRLNVACCKRLTADSFDTLGQLRELNAMESTASMFGALTNLVVLNCSDCTRLGPDALRPLTALESLTCVNTGITSLSTLVNLQDLNCSNCAALPHTAFERLTRLRKLRCVGLDLDSASFDALTDLRDLACCVGISAPVDASVFASLSALRRLDCKGSKLQPGSFRPLRMLTSLDCGGCDTTTEELEGMSPLLRTLFASQSRIASFDAVPNLERLSLSGLLVKLPPRAFVGLRSLRELSVSGCHDNVTTQTLEGLSTLTALYCEGTAVRVGELPLLRSLRMLNCGATETGDGDLDHMQRLRSVATAGTRVTSRGLLPLVCLREIACVGDLGMTNDSILAECRRRLVRAHKACVCALCALTDGCCVGTELGAAAP
jgi:Leucine-rich repeat (LRR) protein